MIFISLFRNKNLYIYWNLKVNLFFQRKQNLKIFKNILYKKMLEDKILITIPKESAKPLISELDQKKKYNNN